MLNGASLFSPHRSSPVHDCPVISGSLDADVQADILSRLYMLRSDPNAVVRQQALMVWKSVVEHTPATLKRTLSRFLPSPINSDCSTAPLINANVLSLPQASSRR